MRDICVVPHPRSCSQETDLKRQNGTHSLQRAASRRDPRPRVRPDITPARRRFPASMTSTSVVQAPGRYLSAESSAILSSPRRPSRRSGSCPRPRVPPGRPPDSFTTCSAGFLAIGVWLSSSFLRHHHESQILLKSQPQICAIGADGEHCFANASIDAGFTAYCPVSAFMPLTYRRSDAGSAMCGFPESLHCSQRQADGLQARQERG